MKVELQTCLTENSDGESVFIIEMENLDCESWLNFNCAIEIAYNKHPAMKNFIAELSSPETTPEREMNIIHNILSQVTTIEGIKNCKLYESSHEKPDGAEKFNKFLPSLALQIEINEFAPFSAVKNQNYFREFVNKITPYLSNMKEIDRNMFEAVITGNPELEEEYVQNYTTDATYYLMSTKDDNLSYQFYIMKKDVIVLFFYTSHTN
jgi:hypothetical protein